MNYAAILVGGGMMSVVVAAGAATAAGPAIDINPPGLSLDQPPAAAVKRSFVVRAATAEPLAVLGVAASDPVIQVEWKVRKPGRLYFITAILPAGYTPPQGRRAGIIITTSRPDAPLVEIPIQVLPAAATRPAPAEAELLIGRPAPGVSLTTTDGQVLRLGRVGHETPPADRTAPPASPRINNSPASPAINDQPPAINDPHHTAPDTASNHHATATCPADAARAQRPVQRPADPGASRRRPKTPCPMNSSLRRCRIRRSK